MHVIGFMIRGLKVSIFPIEWQPKIDNSSTHVINKLVLKEVSIFLLILPRLFKQSKLPPINTVIGCLLKESKNTVFECDLFE